jgi:hypothetical protein
MGLQKPQSPTAGHRKRKSEHIRQLTPESPEASAAAPSAAQVDSSPQEPKAKKSRTNTPWTPAEELRLKQMRDQGNSWSEIAKVSERARREQKLGTETFPFPLHDLT